MSDARMISLDDLKLLRSAPMLNQDQMDYLREELYSYMNEADWFTIGIMASSTKQAIRSLRELEKKMDWPEMTIGSHPKENGPVFLKANQNTQDVYIRIEHGLGEGILISCQSNEESRGTSTLGPLPLDFFSSLNHKSN